jgi:hypothetical protein
MAEAEPWEVAARHLQPAAVAGQEQFRGRPQVQSELVDRADSSRTDQPGSENPTAQNAVGSSVEYQVLRERKRRESLPPLPRQEVAGRLPGRYGTIAPYAPR